MGFSKRMAHAPFRLSVTLHGLNRWSDGDMATAKFGRKLLNHVVLGLDFLPTKNLYASVGYNFLRASEMEINGSSRWAGFTAGTPWLALNPNYTEINVKVVRIITPIIV